MVAPNGARLDQSDHPKVPLSLDEIIATAQACEANGASALHLHIRNQYGQHTLNAKQYREAYNALKVATNLRLQITTEAAGIYDVADQFACLRDIRAEWASVSIREVARDEYYGARLYQMCADQNCQVQHILYNEADAQLLSDWQAKSYIPDVPQDVLMVLGRYDSSPASSPASVHKFLASLPSVASWMVCAFGPSEHACLLEAAKLGGDVRVGFENSMLDEDGTPWTDNAASVATLYTKLKALRQGQT